MFDVPKVVSVRSMADINNRGTLMGPPCETMDGDKISPTMQYGWSGKLVSMPICTRDDSRGGMQIKVTSGNVSKKIGREAV